MDEKFFKKWFGSLNVGLEKMSIDECSRQSMICVFKNLVPDRDFRIECVSSILSGDEKCCHRIIIEEGKDE